MADFIKVDSEQLTAHADLLRRDATSMQDFTYRIFDALAPHDPSKGGGDEVGQALGEQYFSNANALLHAAGVAAMLLIDIADLATAGAQKAAEIELMLARINRDLSVGDAKLPAPIEPPSAPGGTAPRR